MELIQSLCESRLFSSKTTYRHYTGRELAELAYLHIIGLRIISCSHVTILHAKQYALKTNDHHFTKWKQSGTDLYYALFGIKGDHQFHDETSSHYLKTLHLDLPKINAWLTSISSPNDMSELRAHRLFLTLDNQFKVNDGSLRAIRRLAMNWKELSLREKQLCFTRLIQIMRHRAPMSDLMADLTKLSKNNGLELINVEDIDQPEDGTTLWDAARVIHEDDCAATTAADIAPVVIPLGKVLRRRSK